MGESSIFAGELHGNSVTTNGYRFELPDAAQYGLADGACLVGVRPEAITLQKSGEEAQRCHIHNAVYMGNHWEIIADWQGHELLINLKPEAFDEGQKEAWLHFNPTGVFLLPADGQRKSA